MRIRLRYDLWKARYWNRVCEFTYKNDPTRYEKNAVKWNAMRRTYPDLYFSAFVDRRRSHDAIRELKKGRHAHGDRTR